MYKYILKYYKKTSPPKGVRILYTHEYNEKDTGNPMKNLIGYLWVILIGYYTGDPMTNPIGEAPKPTK